MIAASQPTQRPLDARLLVVDQWGEIHHAPRSALIQSLRPGHLVVGNDAATLPASLSGVHLRTGNLLEVRLAGRQSLNVDDVRRFSAIVFGTGDFRTRTEDRPSPPRLLPGDRLALGPLTASIESLQGHPRLISLQFEGSPDEIWAGLASHGHAVQYSHVSVPLALWDVWTPIAGLPVAFEPPSAGFALSWSLIADMRAKGVEFATITHAAGISSTGDPELDHLLPFDEPYRIPQTTASAIRRTHAAGGRVIAIGTTVVRALEHAGDRGQVRPGDGVATQRIGAQTQLRIVDAVLSGTHEQGSSHYELLSAFTDESTLRRITAQLEFHGYRTHEFGDSVLIQSMKQAAIHARSDSLSIARARSSSSFRLR